MELSKRLLIPEGVFCCAIDHNELFYLGVLLDEIFGRDNRIGLVAVETNPGGRSDSTHFATSSEYFLVYENTNSLGLIKDIPKDPYKLKDYKEEDEISKYKLVPLRRTGNNSTPDKRPNLCYPIYYNKETLELQVEKPHEMIQWIEIMPEGSDRMRVWRWSKKRLMNSLADVEVKISNGKYNVFVKDRIRTHEKPKTIWSGSKYDASSHGTKVLQKLKLKEEFSYPKSVFLMKDIIEMLTDEGDLILDFFMGSATTQAVAHKMNRRYIGIEQMDYLENISIERLKKVIDGEQGGISKDVNWQGGGSFVYCELLEDNQVLMKELQEATDSEILKEIIDRATENGKIVPSVLPSDLKQTEAEFDNLDFEEQKHLALELLDKNKLYVNLSDLEDKDMNVSEADKEFTKSFYGLD